LANVPAFSASTGGVLKIQAKGTTISVWYNGVQQLSVTDSTIASGSAGLRIAAPDGVSTVTVTAWDGGGFGPPVPVIPNNLDQGHVFDGVLYNGTLTGWAGRTGLITPNVALGGTAFPVAHTGEVPSARANIDDFTFVPVNGQRVQFYMLRDSANDKIAISIAAL
jgi:hypothetical protein